MSKKLDTKIVRIPNFFTPEEERRMSEKRLKEIKPILNALDKWRAESLHASIVIY